MSRFLPPRIGINAVFLLPGMGGLDTYVRELMGELVRLLPNHSFSIYCSPEGRRHVSQNAWADAVRFVTHPLFGTRGLKAISELTLLGALASRQVDLLHSVAMTAPYRTAAANVVTIADTIWLHGRPADATTLLWRAVIPPVARRADRVIAISQRSANEIEARLGVNRERIDVTLLGYTASPSVQPLPEDETRTRLALGTGPLILMVGTRKPHKNLLRLLGAMPEVLAAQPDATLVLAGNPTAHEDELGARARALGLGDHVRFLGFIEPAELEGLYAAAKCFILPSLEEGFGLPVLEAMARDLPVACSHASALPEVAGDAARYFDPLSERQIAAALTVLLSDERERTRLRELGRERVASLSWRATAQGTLESYARAWRAHHSPPTG